MIVAVGTDAVAIARIARLWQRSGDRFLQRVYTAREADYCRSRAQPAESLAARFAAKEATLKCLGTGWAAGLGFVQIEVVRDVAGAVRLVLHGAAAARAQALGIRRFHLSLTHTDATAIAFVVAEA
jgi:holo-[acyl-carrier protein] synthase